MLILYLYYIFLLTYLNGQDKLGGGWRLLQRIALKVFSMTASSASSERNFSTFGFIHSKLRNSLNSETVKKLV